MLAEWRPKSLRREFYAQSDIRTFCPKFGHNIIGQRARLLRPGAWLLECGHVVDAAIKGASAAGSTLDSIEEL